MQPEQRWRQSMSPARTGTGCGPCTPHCNGCNISGAANCDARRCEAQLHNAALVRSCTFFFHRTHFQSPVHSFTQPSYFDSQESWMFFQRQPCPTKVYKDPTYTNDGHNCTSCGSFCTSCNLAGPGLCDVCASIHERWTCTTSYNISTFSITSPVSINRY